MLMTWMPCCIPLCFMCSLHDSVTIRFFNGAINMIIITLLLHDKLFITKIKRPADYPIILFGVKIQHNGPSNVTLLNKLCSIYMMGRKPIVISRWQTPRNETYMSQLHMQTTITGSFNSH